jgi:hypothetical protein
MGQLRWLIEKFYRQQDVKARPSAPEAAQPVSRETLMTDCGVEPDG